MVAGRAEEVEGNSLTELAEMLVTATGDDVRRRDAKVGDGEWLTTEEIVGEGRSELVVTATNVEAWREPATPTEVASEEEGVRVMLVVVGVGRRSRTDVPLEQNTNVLSTTFSEGLFSKDISWSTRGLLQS